MRVAVFGTRGFPYIQGGVEKHCEYIYSYLADKHEITVFRRIPYVCQTPHSPIHFIDLPSTKIKGFEAFFHSFLCTLICVFKRPDVIHIHNIGPAFFSPLLRLFGLKVVLTYHSPNYEHAKWGRFSKMLLKIAEYISLRASNHIIFVNKYQLEKQNIRIQAKSTYIPNGVVKQRKVVQRGKLFATHGIKNNFILGVGRITPEKGFDVLIQAFQQANVSIYQLVIAGGVDNEHGYFKKLQDMAKDNVVFTGVLTSEELTELYSHASLFVLPSYNEGFPLTLLEAMQLVNKVLVSDLPATRLLALNEEDYVKVGSVTDLAQKIMEKLEQPCFSTVKYNTSSYDWELIASQTEEVYKNASQ
ncbi:glycosyltransferase [Bacteroides sp. 214]|uniref:glycosyltransferase family 4 protein n=1 Tax=Bacteroides sp. 214 TaxID=2302935 RepID=UPI0013D6CFC9|nr:glycosyltransferase [Bacteroides sp. 214]